MVKYPTIIKASSRVSLGEVPRLFITADLCPEHLRSLRLCVLKLLYPRRDRFFGSGSASPSRMPITPWVLRSSQEYMDQTCITNEPSTSLRSFKRLGAGVTRTIAGDIRSTGRRETGTIKEGTPLITTVPYVYEAFSQVYAIDKDQKWLRIMRSIAEHAFTSYRDLELPPDAASCAYTPAPDDPCGVINASAYRAFLLTKAGIELSEPRYLEVAKRNLNFVLASQNTDGSWYYSTDGKRDFVDHFHTCFVLKALAKIDALTGRARCRSAIEHGVQYYLRNLFDANGLPVPFSKAPAAHGLSPGAL